MPSFLQEQSLSASGVKFYTEIASQKTDVRDQLNKISRAGFPSLALPYLIRFKQGSKRREFILKRLVTQHRAEMRRDWLDTTFRSFFLESS